jgi:hypothetical protein
MSTWSTRQRSGWGTTLQAGNSRIPGPIRWIYIFFFLSSIYLILPAAVVLGFTKPLTEMSIRNRKSFWGVEHGHCVGLTNLPLCLSRLPRPVLSNVLMYSGTIHWCLCRCGRHHTTTSATTTTKNRYTFFKEILWKYLTVVRHSKMFFVVKFELILIIGSNNVLTEGARKVYRGRRVGQGWPRPMLLNSRDAAL